MIYKNVIVEIRSVYGAERIYPVCEIAQEFLSLTQNETTLTRSNIESIKRLGFTIKVKAARLHL